MKTAHIMSTLACNSYCFLFEVFWHFKSRLSTFYCEHKLQTVFLPSLFKCFPAKFLNDCFFRFAPVVISRHEGSSPMFNWLRLCLFDSVYTSHTLDSYTRCYLTRLAYVRDLAFVLHRIITLWWRNARARWSSNISAMQKCRKAECPDPQEMRNPLDWLDPWSRRQLE